MQMYLRCRLLQSWPKSRSCCPLMLFLIRYAFVPYQILVCFQLFTHADILQTLFADGPSAGTCARQKYGCRVKMLQLLHGHIITHERLS